jgi:hypothetical protein
LLGAVNRCWKCGQQFIARPTVEGLPPVRAQIAQAAMAEALEAKVLDEPAAAATAAPAGPVAVLVSPPPPPAHPLDTPMPSLRRLVAQPPNFAALGGAYGALLLGLFGLALSWFRYEGAIVAVVGLLAGIWGIYSPRRNWALVGMLLCALAMGVGTFTGVNELYRYLNRNRPVTVEEPAEDEAL